MANLAEAVSRATIIGLEGTFQRHTSPTVVDLRGSASGGRWGVANGYPVLYLGRPTDTVTVEAYRHLVDQTEGLTGDLVGPRALWTCQVNVTQVLDLRDEGSRLAVALTMDDLTSDVDQYAPCQQVAQAAHQLGLHGILAPAATQFGETLALFDHHLPSEELPTVIRKDIWAHLPADPRRLRLVQDQTG